MVEENRMYQQLQKICREKVCCIKVFLGKFGEIQLPAPTHMICLIYPCAPSEQMLSLQPSVLNELPSIRMRKQYGLASFK